MKFLGLTLLLINSLRISYAQDEEFLEVVAIVPGNFTIAAFFSVHEASSNLYYPKCGSIQDQAGMQRVEAAVFEVNKINNENKLKNLSHTFGLEIRDTCGSYVYAFQQGLSIYNDVSGSKKRIIVGTVGPAFSAEIRITHEWLSRYMPQVGFSATSTRMTTKKDEFKNFVRLVPPDNYQADLIFKLLEFFDQKVVNSIITAGVYGSDAIKAFNERIDKNKMLIGSQEIVYDDASKEEMIAIFNNSTEFNRVVVCFCEGRTVRKFYQIAGNLPLKEQLLFISSDGWTEIDNITQNYRGKTFGSIMINTSPQLKLEDDFMNQYRSNFYDNLSESNTNTSENPWVKEFYEHRFKCSSTNSSKSSGNSTTGVCSGDETFRKKFFPDPKLPLVRYSIRAIADAANNYVENLCKKLPCNQNLTMANFVNLSSHFMNFTRRNPIKYGNNSLFQFNEKGDPEISNYDILSYGEEEDGNFTFRVIGSWNNINGLTMNNNTFINMFNKYRKIKDRCQIPCKIGEFKRVKNSCWSCKKCNDSSVSDGTVTECTECPRCMRPNPSKSECIDKENSLIKYDEVVGFICIFISLLGAVLTSCTARVFYKYRRTPIVKFSSTHLSYIIFCGMGLGYSCTLLNLLEPRYFTCIILRFLPSISMTMIYSPILLKTNRISRALAAGKKKFPTLRMKYLSAAFLVSASLVVVLVDVIICTVLTIIGAKEHEMIIEPDCTGDIKIVFCPMETIAQFNYRHILNVVLLLYCASYAYRSGLHLPDNFNETKFVIISCGSTGVVWAVFYATFLLFQTPEDWAKRTISLSMALSLSALINLVCMYFPKLYIILYRPRQNHRAFYSTVTEMRCYFGNTESRCRGYSSVNMDSTAGDPSMMIGENVKNKKDLKRKKRRKKSGRDAKKSRLSNCGANGLVCTCQAISSMNN